ncbi:hypothetical protein [Corynebacterium sp.]|uniref:hypothetical protein n=1 Tax=Corynebacterium sp. TaxID=1720 RepID=UPI0025C667B5|nr:hypothetical protein [Corynebacterium sp.]
MTPLQGQTEILEPEVWRSHQREHRRAVDELTAGHRARRARGERPPGWDFMFTYYPAPET